MVASCCIGGVRWFFTFGGRRTIQGEVETTCLRYSITGNRWSSAADMHHARGLGRAVRQGDRIYVIGGCEDFGAGLGVVEAYAPLTNEWDGLDDMPEPRYDFAAACWRDSLIYLFGGGNWSPSSPLTDHVWLFDPSADRWDVATPLPGPLGAAAAEIVADTIVLFGGWSPTGMTNAAWRGTIDARNPAVIAWHRLDTLPGERRCRVASGAVGGAVIVAGGLLPSGQVTGEAWQLELASETWTRLPDKPHPTTDICGSARDGTRLFFPGGYTGAGRCGTVHDMLDLGNPDHDVAVLGVTSPVGRLVPDIAYPVLVSVENPGDYRLSVTLVVQVRDTVTGLPQFDADTLFALDPGQQSTVHVGYFAPGPDGYYGVWASTSTPGDENPENDSASARCRSASASEPDGFGYVYRSTQEPDSVAFSWLAAAPADTLRDWEPNADDGVCPVELPFSFPFYGDSLTTLFVATDGFLAGSGLPRPHNAGLPDFELSDVIAPFWDDLNLREHGTVTRTSLPGTVIFSWLDVPRYESDSERVTFQVALVADGRVAFNYLDIDAPGSSSSAGIQGDDGSWNWYLQYCHDGLPERHVPADSVSVQFLPPGVGIREPGAGPAPVPGFSAPGIVHAGPLTLRFAAGKAPRELSVYDATGLRVATLSPAAGPVEWHLTDARGRCVPQGAYFIEARFPGRRIVRKVVVVR